MAGIPAHERERLLTALKSAGLSESDARRRVHEIVELNRPYNTWRILFEDQIDKLVTDAKRDLDKIRDAQRRKTAFLMALADLTKHANRPKPRANRAREALEELGLPTRAINWALTERVPFSNSRALAKLEQYQREGKSTRERERLILVAAAQDKVMDAVMRTEVEGLGAVVTIITIIIGAIGLIWAIIDAIRGWVGASREADATERFREEQKNLPVTALDIRTFVETAGDVGWDRLVEETLVGLAVIRDGRRHFVENEEQRLRTAWAAARKIRRDEARSVQRHEIRGQETTRRQREAASQADVRAAAIREAYRRLAREESSASTDRLVSIAGLAARWALPAAAVAAVGVAILRSRS